MPGIYSQLSQLISDNRPAALATVVGGEHVGAKALISTDGVIAGGIHPDLDERIVADALDLLAGEVSETRTYIIGSEQVEVFIETYPSPQRLIIVGAVHVAIPLHHLAKMLGY